jgi:hypothetical protein
MKPPKSAARNDHKLQDPLHRPDELDHPPTDHQQHRRRTCHLAMVALLLGALSFLLPIAAAVPAVVVAIIAIKKIRRNISQLKGLPVAALAIFLAVISTLIFACLFYLWTLDALPILNSRTLNDRRSAPPQFNETLASSKPPPPAGATSRDSLPHLPIA